MSNAVVRPATAADAASMAEVGREFYDLTALERFVAYDPESVAQFLTGLIASGTAGVFVAEHNGAIVGGAAVALVPLFFNARHTMAHELFWFLSTKHRGGSTALRLYNAVERWSKERGASLMLMTALAQNEDVARVYERRGYMKQETNFVKGTR